LTRKLSVGNFALEGPVGDLAASLFSYGGNVPFLQLGFFFRTFQKLRTMLTPTGIGQLWLWDFGRIDGEVVPASYITLGQLTKCDSRKKRGLAEGMAVEDPNIW
jgi:hypothetical protein